ncbi:MAG: hypothetical protein KF760_09365 [Candidatus Eremiobacteraeota bacterium]|nr:hypothetical protein [Candidatus Eremiobacteraeota bacterium]MCW5866032.1 hypothetical protein [Candidatus Eremiobacteraeota bacterium]
MAEKLSDLERWLQQMQGEGERDSSGHFTVDAGSRLDRYRSLLELNPSLPWLQLTQWAHRQRAVAIEFRVLRDAVEWVARGLQSDEDWCERLGQVSGEDSLLLLLHAWKPQAMQFVWTHRKAGWAWAWPGPAQVQTRAVEDSVQGEMVVRLQISLTPTQRRDLLSEFTARTHFAPIPMRIDGRPHPSRLDLTSAQSRSFGVAADLVSARTQSGADYFAVVHPAAHEARLTLVNAGRATSMHQEPGEAPPGKVACYHLHHPELAAATCSKHEIAIDLGQLGLRDSADFLDMPRRWSGWSFLGIQFMAQTLRPLRARSLYLLSAHPDKGTVFIIPVRQGVSLNPISTNGSRRGSTTISICPEGLKTDLSGLRLVEDAACGAWLQGVVDASRRCL